MEEAEAFTEFYSMAGTVIGNSDRAAREKQIRHR